MKKHLFFTMVLAIASLSISGCGSIFLVRQYGEGVPPKSGFHIFPSLDGKTALIQFSAHPIGGDHLRFTVVSNSPKHWKLDKAEYTLDGENWHNLPFGLHKFGASTRYHTAKVRNQHDYKERIIGIRAWFCSDFRGIDTYTGKPFTEPTDKVGPIFANLTVWHN